ncbi:MAG: hypothetical protein J5979_00330 [Lachnospiraceae bacterium]|nr:hypothetical protein [Lachnospiraceae bacterium]
MNKLTRNRDGSLEQDKIFLCDRLLHKKGEIYPIESLKTTMNLNSNDEVSFRLYKYNSGKPNPFWNQVDDLSIILVDGKGFFELSVPKTTEDCEYKDITGISLCEAETAQTNITLQINTEDDHAREDYVSGLPTILYRNPENYENYNDIWSNPENKQKCTVYNHDGTVNLNSTITKRKTALMHSSLLHRIFHEMPHYKIGHVDPSIAELQRTFSCDNQSVYDFLQTVAEELECIFLFDRFSRTVNCYSLKDYGKDSGVFIDGTQNLAENITLTGNKDSVKNCFKIEGGDDTITNRIGNRLIGGNRIWKFSDYQLSQMSETLQNAFAQRESLVQQNQDTYIRLWDDYNKIREKLQYYQSAMMPSETTDETTAESVFQELFGKNGKITYSCTSNKYQSSDGVLKSIHNFAKIIAPSTYTVELTEVSHSNYEDDGTVSSITFQVHVYLTGQYENDANGNNQFADEYPSPGKTKEITLPVKKGYQMHDTSDNTIFTTDYYLYLKQQMEMAEEKNKITDEVIIFDPPLDEKVIYDSETTPLQYASYDNEINPEAFRSIHYTMYCIDRLQSFYDAYESCSQVLAKWNNDIASNAISGNASDKILKYITPSGDQESIYDALLGKYGRYMELISARIRFLQSKVDTLTAESESIYAQIQEIKELCDMQNFLQNYEDGIYGDSLWTELCSFRREDTYKNENFVGEDRDEKMLMENVELLIEQAEKEITKACEINYSITATLDNLMTMREFEPFWDDFSLGNYIHIRIDGEIYKLRLISISYHYDDLSHIEVEFSDITKNKNTVNDLKEILQQAQSTASSFQFVARQAEKGNDAKNELNHIRLQGLDIATTMITNADKQEFVLNEYGITGRKWDELSESYESQQIRIINNLLCFTDDDWKHTRTAIGKIHYYDTEQKETVCAYGINTEVLIGELVLSEQLRITNASGNYVFDHNGFKMSKENASITFDPSNPSIVACNGEKNVLDFNSNGDGKLVIQGEIEGSNITGCSITGDNVSSSSINIREKFKVNPEGKLIAENADIKAGKIGSWVLQGGTLSYGDTTSDFFMKLDAVNKSIVSKNGNQKSVLSSGTLYFYQNDTKYVTIHTANWNGTSTYGVGIHSEPESKFISFGNRTSENDSSYATPLLLNYGLNPDGKIQPVQIYGDTYMNGNLWLTGDIVLGDGYYGVIKNANYSHHIMIWWDENKLCCQIDDTPFTIPLIKSDGTQIP